MTVTVLDAETGELRQDSDGDFWWWSEGGGSCDCNRQTLFGGEKQAGTCLGCHQFVIVECSDPSVSLIELNQGYPAELLLRVGVAGG